MGHGDGPPRAARPRGLPGGDTLARLLARHRGTRNRKALPALSVERIERWARAHFRRTGSWPRRADGPIADAEGETWMAVEVALSHGQRGLPGGSSLAQVVAECRSVRSTSRSDARAES
jgi:hypothetical protein